MLLGSIEAGGTKFIAAVGDEHMNIIDTVTVPTTKPDETMEQISNFFSRYHLDALGVGSFGPIDVDEKSQTFGYITSTPKSFWRDYNFVGYLKQKLNVPVAWTTDVNAAGYGEYLLGNANGTESCLYLTIGTGIGGGFINKGQILNAFSHPEMGHVFIKRHPDDTFEGICPFHKNCLEGMASGPAVEKRWGKKGVELADQSFVWELEAYYLAQALISYTLILRPERIILGGGLMKQKQIFKLIRNEFHAMLNDYVEVPDLETYIQPVGLNDQAGIIGGLLLAKNKLKG
ncbi:ROK family protein [Sporolactobacillus laevolacticus]|uniref:fructokinase n=1 Tax=Sporolactobacillus laevolacticus DSM 442 TaxID=1395513 RepID=V6IX58_9BACL|nr:ROK family protein [Sporolactobacillus laevolacticus]EST11902.1 fructokinase [Sporolactobacillus laevolacticus DSM 442]